MLWSSPKLPLSFLREHSFADYYMSNFLTSFKIRYLVFALSLFFSCSPTVHPFSASSMDTFDAGSGISPHSFPVGLYELTHKSSPSRCLQGLQPHFTPPSELYKMHSNVPALDYFGMILRECLNKCSVLSSPGQHGFVVLSPFARKWPDKCRC